MNEPRDRELRCARYTAAPGCIRTQILATSLRGRAKLLPTPQGRPDVWHCGKNALSSLERGWGGFCLSHWSHSDGTVRPGEPNKIRHLGASGPKRKTSENPSVPHLGPQSANFAGKFTFAACTRPSPCGPFCRVGSTGEVATLIRRGPAD